MEDLYSSYLYMERDNRQFEYIRTFGRLGRIHERNSKCLLCRLSSLL